MRVALALLALVLAGCGGAGASSTGSKLELSDLSDFNGLSYDLNANPSRKIERNRTTLRMESDGRAFRFVLHVDTMRKGQNLDLGSGDADATYTESSEKVWVATGGRVRVVSEIGEAYLVRIEDADFEPRDEDREATGTFRANGTLRR